MKQRELLNTLRFLSVNINRKHCVNFFRHVYKVMKEELQDLVSYMSASYGENTGLQCSEGRQRVLITGLNPVS